MSQRINLGQVNIEQFVDLCHIDTGRGRRNQEPTMIIRLHPDEVSLGDRLIEITGTLGEFRELAGQIGLRVAEAEQVARPTDRFVNVGVEL